MNQVIVIGPDHHNTLGVIRSFGENGIRPHLIVYSKHLYNVFVTKSKYLASINKFSECDASIIDLLVSVFENRDKPTVIMGTSDEACLLIDSNLNRLKNFICASCRCQQDGITHWMDKHRMNELAKLSGIDVPEGIILQSGEALDIGSVSFPCIVKPIKSTKGNKRDISICKDEKELVNLLTIPRNLNNDLLIQEFILAEYEIGIMGCSYYRSNECWIPAVITKMRFFNKSTTYAMIDDITKKAELKNTVERLTKLVNQIGYNGIFDFDLIYCNGTFYFIEMNLRNGAYGYGLSKAGANFPYNWYCEATTGKHENHEKVKHSYLMSEFSDFIIARREGVPLLKWFKEYSNSTHMVFQFKDIRPIVSFLKQKVISWQNLI